MHAILFIGGNLSLLTKKIEEFSKEDGLNLFPFPVGKIEDVRQLEKFLSVKRDNLAIYLADFDKATEEAQMAILKTLEEPKNNIKFYLTASVLGRILPTIISRCVICEVGGSELTKTSTSFLDLKVGEKLKVVSSIRTREEAIEFCRENILFLHKLLISKNNNHSMIASGLKEFTKTKGFLEMNGNVTLQLTRLVTSLESEPKI